MQSLRAPLPSPVQTLQKPAWKPIFADSVVGQIASLQCSRIPHFLDRQLRVVERVERAGDVSPAPADYVSAFWDEKMQGFAERRKVEHRLAAYIESQVLPVAFERQELERIVDALRACRMRGDHGLGLFESAQESVRDDGSKYHARSVQGIVRYDSKCSLPRLCPDESRREGQRIASKYVPAMMALAHGKSRRVYYLVFTTPNAAPGALHDEKRDQYRLFANLVKRWKRNPESFGMRKGGRFVGALTSQEDPLSSTGTWNVHLNVMLVTQGTFSFEDLRRQWGANVEIRELPSSDEKALSRAMVELCKYQVKHVTEKSHKGRTSAPGMTSWPPLLWLEWYRANRGFKRTRSYGALHGIEDAEKSVMLDSIWAGRFEVVAGKVEYGLYESARAAIDLILGNRSDTGKDGAWSKMLESGSFPRPPGWHDPGGGGGGTDYDDDFDF